MEKKTDFKALPPKSKAQYLWDYYRWPFIITVLVAAVIISLIHTYVSYKEPSLNVIMINSPGWESVGSEGFDSFLDAYGYDSTEQPVSINGNFYFTDDDYSSSYQELEALSVTIFAGGQDIFFGTGSVFLDYAEEGALLDLSTILPEDVLEQYSDSLIYSTENGECEPYPCAVELSDNDWLSASGYYDSCYFGVFLNADHPDAAALFANFLLN
jgi:ABC-type glycerol-3-phosphate transport system substrate-binding protein